MCCENYNRFFVYAALVVFNFILCSLQKFCKFVCVCNCIGNGCRCASLYAVALAVLCALCAVLCVCHNFNVLSCFCFALLCLRLRAFSFNFTPAKLQIYFELTKKIFTFSDKFLLSGAFIGSYEEKIFSYPCIFGRFWTCKIAFLSVENTIFSVYFAQFKQLSV